MASTLHHGGRFGGKTILVFRRCSSTRCGRTPDSLKFPRPDTCLEWSVRAGLKRPSSVKISIMRRLADNTVARHGARVLMRTARERACPACLMAEAPMRGKRRRPLQTWQAMSPSRLRAARLAEHDDLDIRRSADVCCLETGILVCVTDGSKGVTWRHGAASGCFEACVAIKTD